MIEMSVVPELLAANKRYAARFTKGDLRRRPARRVAILTSRRRASTWPSFWGFRRATRTSSLVSNRTSESHCNNRGSTGTGRKPLTLHRRLMIAIYL